MDNRVDIVLDDGGASSLWWATKNEWLGLLDVAGLELEALFGSFDREPLDNDSREYVFGGPPLSEGGLSEIPEYWRRQLSLTLRECTGARGLLRRACGGAL